MTPVHRSHLECPTSKYDLFAQVAADASCRMPARTSIYVHKHVHGTKKQQQSSGCQPGRSHRVDVHVYRDQRWPCDGLTGRRSVSSLPVESFLQITHPSRLARDRAAQSEAPAKLCKCQVHMRLSCGTSRAAVALATRTRMRYVIQLQVDPQMVPLSEKERMVSV